MAITNKMNFRKYLNRIPSLFAAAVECHNSNLEKTGIVNLRTRNKKPNLVGSNRSIPKKHDKSFSSKII
ncbi:hypothetical protein BpHYR1_029209 [Brachionus plicatilis]|uniref:Uncharacterized protein n=1 Tax=Brachionus plicatilis TaxID=10195 RepID=A0A3M7P134_BRAPC|nr:hypothetical protein BpHYR1_029209 [Brachionus plicatilis]